MTGIIANNFGSFPVVFEKGKGAILIDENGKKYIDFVAGIGVNCLGHNHPVLTRTLKRQISKQIHVSNYYNSDAGLAFSSALTKATGLDRCFFGNSGAEANEAAIKLARKWGWLTSTEQMTVTGELTGKAPVTPAVERNVIVTLEKSFHGRTITTLAATGQDKFHPAAFAPYPVGFKTIKANDYNELAKLDNSVCGVLMECVQGEGGVNLVDPEWAKALQEKAHDCGALFMCDEVQTGMGRTGKLLASQLLNLEPDAVSLAKGIAGGVPMGALVYGRRAVNVFVAGDHQSTFGGNPLACAGGCAVLSVLTAPGFFESVAEKGSYIRDTIAGWKLSCVKDIRGKGLMIGIDITQSSATVQKAMLENGVCCSTAGANTVRFLPPLIISYKQIDSALAVFKHLLESIN